MTWIDDLVIGLVALFFAAIAGLVIFMVVKVILGEDYAIMKKKEGEENLGEGVDGAPLIDPTPAEFYEVKAISKRIYNEFLGIKVVKSQFWFLNTFQFPNGEEKEVAVPQETFEKVSVGDKGTLVILNGAFFDFGDGEMMEKKGRVRCVNSIMLPIFLLKCLIGNKKAKQFAWLF